ncbi:MAG: iron-sulfur cluster assembly scaffold protein [Verrucomicrobiota bacterium]
MSRESEKSSSPMDGPVKTQNMGELKDADSVGTAGSPGCGDMLRMWMKFRDNESGNKVIDQATFQSFGCETAIAVASVATELLQGKTVEEARSMKGEELSAPLGPLPPMKIHCASLVEEAMKQALDNFSKEEKVSMKSMDIPDQKGTLVDNMQALSASGQKAKIVFKDRKTKDL